MSRSKHEGALKAKQQLETKIFEAFPEWRRQLMISADENDSPMLREHIEGYKDAERLMVQPTAPTNEVESGVMAERLYHASKTTDNPQGLRLKDQAQVNEWKVLPDTRRQDAIRRGDSVNATGKECSGLADRSAVVQVMGGEFEGA